MVPTGPELGERSSYIGASSSSGYELLNAFATIAHYPQGLPKSKIKVLKSNSTPPKTTADLAQGFEDDYEMSYETAEGSGAGTSYDDGGTTEEAAGDYNYAEASGDHRASTPDEGTPFSQTVTELPIDAEHVDVKYRIDEAGEYIYRFDDSLGSRRDVKASEWESRTTLYNGEAMKCFLTTRSSGKGYWTWTLDPTMLTRYERKGKGRG